MASFSFSAAAHSSVSVGSFDSYPSPATATATATASAAGDRYQDPRTQSVEHHHHPHTDTYTYTYTDSAILTTPSHSPPSSPRLAPPLSSSSPSCMHSASSTPSASPKSTTSTRPTATASTASSPSIITNINRQAQSPASARALVTPWELRQPTSLGSAPESSPSIAIAQPKPTSFASFSLSRSPSRSKHQHDRPDHPSRPRTMSPVALTAAPPSTTLHHTPSNTFLGAAFARASSMSKSHHSWRGAGAARPPPASAFTTRPPGMATQMPVLARRNARIGYTKWSPRWIVIDHVDGVLHVYKDPHSLVPTDSIQVSSAHTTIQHAIDRNTGVQMLKVYYLSSRYRFRTDPNVLRAWDSTVPDLALRPGTSPSNLNLLLDALNRSATAPDRAPVWIPTKAEGSASLAVGHEQVSSSMPSSYANSSTSSDSDSSVVFDAPLSTIDPESWSVPSTLSRNTSTRKAPPPLILRPMSASPLMRRPASAPLLSPTSAAAAAAAATSSPAPPGHRLPMPSPWHREAASAGFAVSPSPASAYESTPYSVSSTRSSTGSKYMDELMFLDPYFQSQKHHHGGHPVAQAVEAQACHGHVGTRSPLNPFAG